MRTPVLVLDEPTTGQDARGVDRVRAWCEPCAAEGRTVIAISHDMRFVAETFERVIVMRAGRVILDGHAGGGLRRRCLGGAALDVPRAAARRAGRRAAAASGRRRPTRR